MRSHKVQLFQGMISEPMHVNFKRLKYDTLLKPTTDVMLTYNEITVWAWLKVEQFGVQQLIALNKFNTGPNCAVKETTLSH